MLQQRHTIYLFIQWGFDLFSLPYLVYLFHASKLGHSYHWREEPCVSLVFMASGCGFTLGGPLGLPSTLWAKPDFVSLAHNGGPPQGEFTIPRGWCKLFARGYSNTATRIAVSPKSGWVPTGAGPVLWATPQSQHEGGIAPMEWPSLVEGPRDQHTTL